MAEHGWNGEPMTEGAVPTRHDPALIDRLLKGAVDLHCHSGPSVMARRIDHLDVMKEAGAAGMRALLIKDHYYSATPVTELLNAHFGACGVTLLSGVPLNNTVGGFNPHAVDHGIKLGARLVWMPTFSARNHIAHETADENFHKKFPTPKRRMLAPLPLDALDEAGRVKDEVKAVLDLIAEADIVLSAGHLHISEIWPVFERAKSAGVKRFLVNHPSYIIDATLQDMRELTAFGAYLEHSLCMFIPGSLYHCYSADALDEMIRAGGVDHTILGSDLGQVGNPTPVEGFRHVIATCLDLGYSEDDIRKLISSNACALLGLEAAPPSHKPMHAHDRTPGL